MTQQPHLMSVVPADWPARARLVLALLGFTLTVCGVSLRFVWNSSEKLTQITYDIRQLSERVDTNAVERKRDLDSRQATYTAEMNSLDRRIGMLETRSGVADEQINRTQQAISGLQAQTSAMQGALNDLREGVNAIRSEISRIANAPLPVKQRH